MNEVISDPLDVASQQEQKQNEMSIKYVQANANKLEVEPIGSCLYCGEEFKDGSELRWCDKFCLSLWEKQKLFRR